MHPALKSMCNQTITRYAYVASDRNNDFSWQTDVSKQHVTLTGTTGTVLHTYIMSGSVIVSTTDDVTTYTLNLDYTVNYTTGSIARTSTSTIPTGATVHISYSWQTVTTFLARVEHKNVMVRNSLGQEMLSTCQIYCDSDAVIDPKDKIACDDFTVTYPEILSVESNPDENGDIDHQVIYTTYKRKQYRSI
jgi:hypothetical protein